jgi:hypothetical protein
VRTPAAIVRTLNSEINAALLDQKIAARFENLGLRPLPGSRADFGKLIARAHGYPLHVGQKNIFEPNPSGSTDDFASSFPRFTTGTLSFTRGVSVLAETSQPSALLSHFI